MMLVTKLRLRILPHEDLQSIATRGRQRPGGRPPASAIPGPASWGPVHPPLTAGPRPPSGLKSEMYVNCVKGDF